MSVPQPPDRHLLHGLGREGDLMPCTPLSLIWSPQVRLAHSQSRFAPIHPTADSAPKKRRGSSHSPQKSPTQMSPKSPLIWLSGGQDDPFPRVFPEENLVLAHSLFVLGRGRGGGGGVSPIPDPPVGRGRRFPARPPSLREPARYYSARIRVMIILSIRLPYHGSPTSGLPMNFSELGKGDSLPPPPPPLGAPPAP